MKFLELLIDSLNPYGVYVSSQNIATQVFIFITPFLLIIAVAIRTLETQLDTVSSLGKWEKALRDFILFGFVIVSYYFILTLINQFMNEIYLITNDFGNYKTLSKKLQVLMDKSLGLRSDSPEWLNKLKTLDITPQGTVIFLIYRVSNIFVVGTYVFLQAAHAITYSFAFVVGLIVLPMAITQKLNVLKGWCLILVTALFWPIAESIFMGFTGNMFIKSIEIMLKEQASLGPGVGLEDISEMRAFFATINFVLGMIMITAPFVTAAIVMGGNAMFPMVAPFATGSMALAGTAFAAGRSFMPGAAGLGALGGMMIPKGGSGTSPSGGGGGGESSGSDGGSSGYSGGPKPRSGGSGASSGSSDSPSGGSSAGSGGDGGNSSSNESGPSPRSEESKEAEQQAKEKKIRRGKTGYWSNQARKKKTTTS